MKQAEVEVGQHYWARVSGQMQVVRIERNRGHQHTGGYPGKVAHMGWDAVNTATNKKVWIRSAQRLQKKATAPAGFVERILDVVDSKLHTGRITGSSVEYGG
jgi:hypothetical protein